MNDLSTTRMAICATLLVLAMAGNSAAQHFDVLVQQMDGQLVTGSADFDTGRWTLGRRVYFREFLLDFGVLTTDNPGFNSIGAGSPTLPAGSQALPGETHLEWDFLPMTTNDTTSNLFYWDGMDVDGVPGLTPDDVVFGSPPGPDYGLSLFGRQDLKFTADGSDQLVPGGVIARTLSDGSIHWHRFFLLESGDGGQPADGIYLISMQLRMSGLADSLPIFLVFGTPGSSVEALDDAAVPWVEQNMLGLPGDYNGNGVVDATDYVVWRSMLGQEVVVPGAGADGDESGMVDAEDYSVWKRNFGRSAGSSGGGAAVAGSTNGAVPEPASGLLVLTGLTGVLRVRSKLHRR